MTISLGLNISSLIAQRQLSRSSDELSNVFTRLSSGQRINRASDDAAGLAIADSLNADARVYNQGVRNLNDGISVINIADGALQELTNITFRLTELAEQAANGTLGNSQRASLDEEAQALKAEYFRIAKSTEFNGRKLFEGSYGELRLQGGYGLDASIGSGLGGAIGTGEFTANAYTISPGASFKIERILDFNGDGNLDIYAGGLHLGNGQGQFTNIGTPDLGFTEGAVVAGDFNNDGIYDLVINEALTGNISIFSGNGDGTFQETSTVVLPGTLSGIHGADYNNDGYEDLIVRAGTDWLVLFNEGGSGTFSQSASSSTIGSSVSVLFGDLNNDGIPDAVRESNTFVSVNIGNADGTYGATATYAIDSAEAMGHVLGDFNNDGNIDIVTANYEDNSISVLLGNGNGTFQNSISIATNNDPVGLLAGDFNGDGNLDLIVEKDSTADEEVLFGDGQGSFASAGSGDFTAGQLGYAADFNNDGVLDFFATNSIVLGNTTSGVSPLLDFSLSSIADAKQALSQFGHKLDQLSRQRGQIGAFQSRVEVAEKVLSVSAENFKSAESRIRDADISQESANLVRLQILQQAASAVLGQANQQPQLVLQLLGGNV